MRALRAGFAGVDCELRKIAASPCGSEVVPNRVQRRIVKAVTRARRLLALAAHGGPAKRIDRLVRKAGRVLDHLERQTRRSAKLAPVCRTTIVEMIAERRQRVATLAP